MEPLTIFLATVAALLVLAGLFGALLPVLPGPPLVFSGLWLAAWMGGYEHVGGRVILVLAAITVVAVLLDFVASALGARRVGASPLAVVGAFGGAMVGIFFGIPGILLGPFVGAVAGELIARKDLAGAADVGVGTWIGLVLGAVAKVALSLLMILIFTVAWWM